MVKAQSQTQSDDDLVIHPQAMGSLLESISLPEDIQERPATEHFLVEAILADPTELLAQWPETAEEAPQPPQTLPQKPSWGLLKFCITACCVFSGIAGAALIWLLSLPPVPNCQQLSTFSPDIERLYCAQEAARSGELPQLLNGLKMLGQWPSDHPLFEEAQRWTKGWSQSVLAVAQQKMQQNDFNGAVELANQIPPSSLVYPTAQAEIARWKGQWHESDGIAAEAREAMQQQNWEGASEKILALRELPATDWRSQQANALTQQLLNEKHARQLLSQAQTLAQTGEPEALSAAIALINQMNPKTAAWSASQTDFQHWSEQLLAIGFQQWQAGNLSQAIAMAQQVALNPTLAAEANNLIWLSHARQLVVESSTTGEVTPIQLTHLMSAVAIADQIQPRSQFYPQAQESLKNWQAQLQDVMQLQFAQIAARLEYPVTLQFAANQAQQIGPERPQRLQAQTLAAHWHKEVERVADRPYLTAARQLAAAGTPAALEAAIAQAIRIAPDHALRGEAQSLIFVWKQQIETLEDQPLLNQAQAFARQGKISKAIETAESIEPGRVLYLQAQDAIEEWMGLLYSRQIADSRGTTTVRASAASTPKKSEGATPKKSEASEKSQPPVFRNNSEPNPKFAPPIQAPVAPVIALPEPPKSPTSPGIAPPEDMKPNPRPPELTPMSGQPEPSKDSVVVPVIRGAEPEAPRQSSAAPSTGRP